MVKFNFGSLNFAFKVTLEPKPNSLVWYWIPFKLVVDGLTIALKLALPILGVVGLVVELAEEEVVVGEDEGVWLFALEEPQETTQAGIIQPIETIPKVPKIILVNFFLFFIDPISFFY